MVHAGQRDDECAALLRFMGQQHGHGISARIGDGDEHVARFDGVALKQRRHPCFAPLFKRAACSADMEHQLFVHNRTDARHAACPIEDLKREQMAVAGAECVDHASALQAVGDMTGGAQIYVKAAEKLGQPVESILFLDDNYNADKTAKSAGMKVCGVYDNSSAEYTDDIKAVADHYINDFSELLNIK